MMIKYIKGKCPRCGKEVEIRIIGVEEDSLEKTFTCSNCKLHRHYNNGIMQADDSEYEKTMNNLTK